MTEQEEIKKAIRHFECMKNDAVAVLDSGFGIHKGESDLVYRNRKLYAELAIKALEKQIAKKAIYDNYHRAGYRCQNCNNTNPFGYKYCKHCGQKLDWSDED